MWGHKLYGCSHFDVMFVSRGWTSLLSSRQESLLRLLCDMVRTNTSDGDLWHVATLVAQQSTAAMCLPTTLEKHWWHLFQLHLWCWLLDVCASTQPRDYSLQCTRNHNKQASNQLEHTQHFGGGCSSASHCSAGNVDIPFDFAKQIDGIWQADDDSTCRAEISPSIA